MAFVSRAGWGREDGQAAPEYLGIISVAVACVLVLALAATGVGGRIFAAIEAVICRITGGSCTTAQILAKPTEPCDVNVHSAEAEGGVTVFSVDLGARGKWTLTERSDRTYQVTVAGGGDLGAKFGAGAEGRLSLGKDEHSAGRHAELTVGLTGTGARTWKFVSEDEAKEFYAAATHEPLKQAATGWMGPLQPLGMWAADKIDGHDWDPPTADETFYEGGVYGEFKGTLGQLTVGAGAQELLGVKTVDKGPEKGTKTVYFKVKADGSVEGGAGLSGTPLALTGSGKLAGEAVMALTYDPQGEPKEMKVEMVGELAGAAGSSAEIKGMDAKALLASLRKVSTDGSAETGKKGVVTMTVDLTNPTNRTAAADLLHSLGVPVLRGDGSPDPSGPSALSTLYDQFDNPQGGTRLAVTTYDTDGTKYGAGLKGAKGVQFGVTGDLSFADEEISSASYYVPGQGMVTWKECRAA